ncbi:TRAP transporter small permease subunit [Alcaligenaceae bacterium]|nr:TRAP transporter small permease subunit [Alcaligenaceae bacterium]
MLTLIWLSDRLDRLVQRMGALGSYAMLALIAVIMFDVIVRRFSSLQVWLMSTPVGPYLTSTRLQELEWHIHAVVVFLALGYAYMRDAHVRIDIVRQRFGARGQAVIELAGLLILMIPFLAVVGYFGWFFVERSYISGEGSSSMAGLGNRWIIKSFLVAGVVLALCAALSVLTRIILFLSGRHREAALSRLPMLTDKA